MSKYEATIRQHLEERTSPGDHLIASVYAYRKPSLLRKLLLGAFSNLTMNFYGLGATESGLLLLEYSMMMAPKGLTFVPWNEALGLTVKPGLLEHKVRFKTAAGQSWPLTISRIAPHGDWDGLKAAVEAHKVG